MMKNSPAPRSAVEVLEARIAPATFTVTTVADSGPGSLRQAILDANALSGLDSIVFNLSASASTVITPLSPLPAITDLIEISGLIGSTGKVRLDGGSAGADTDGLVIAIPGTRPPNSTGFQAKVHDLDIIHFSGAGVLLRDTQSASVYSNVISENGGDGIRVFRGGSSAGPYNVNILSDNAITGNAGNGIAIDSSEFTDVRHNTVSENHENGIFINTSNGTKVGSAIGSFGSPDFGNAIDANGLFGILIRGGSDNQIARNVITGNGSMAPLATEGGGIAVIDAAKTQIGLPTDFSGSILGGYTYVRGNNILSNIGTGVLLQGSLTTGTVVAANVIQSNSADGVRLDGAVNTTFSSLEVVRPGGGRNFETLKGNGISSNGGWGVAAVNGAAGVNIRGSSLLNNVSGSILLDGMSGAVIGGAGIYYIYDPVHPFPEGPSRESSRDRNEVGTSGAGGVIVKNSTGVNIAGNRFLGNGLPIDLGGDGATVNDPGDTDEGANHLQNYPTLVYTPAHQDVGGQLASTLSGTPDTTFRVDVYAYDPATAIYSYVTAAQVKTDAGGNAVYNFPGLQNSKFFATATNLTTGETSELSSGASVVAGVTVTPVSVIEGNSGIKVATFAITLDHAVEQPVSIGYKTADGTAKAGEDYEAVEGTVVFQPGETSKVVNVPVFEDSIQEATETFNLNLTSTGPAVLISAQVQGTIVNDDQVPTISIHDVLTVEGANASSSHPGYSEVQYTLSLSNTSLDAVTVKLSAAGGSAMVRADYEAFDGVVTFAPGVTSVTKAIYVKDDAAREDTETIQLQLSQPSAGTLGSANATLTIADNDTWVIKSDAVQIVEGQNGQTMAQVHVRLVNSYGVADHDQPISVSFATQDGTAVAGSDYVASLGTLTFQPGEFEKIVSVPIVGDAVPEQNESFSLKFSSPVAATLSESSQSVTILNDDAGTLSVSPASIVEGHSGQKMLVFDVTLSVPTIGTASVAYETLGGTAFAGTDFEAATGSLSFAPGETHKTVSVPIYGDRLGEADETFTLHLKEPVGATIAQADATGTILNDDPTVSIADGQFAEGDSPTPSPHSVYIPVKLSQATDIPVSVNFSTLDGTAQASSDYVSTSGTLTFAAGQTVQYIEVQIIGDTVYEPNETFSISLSDAQGAALGKSTGVFTIQTDEPFFSAQDVSVTEGNSGAKMLTFTVSLSYPQSTAVSLDFTTADGTALAASDYTAASGTLIFEPGEIAKLISVPILGDTTYEADETLRLVFSNAAGAGLAGTEVHGTILNNDAPVVLPVLSVSHASAIEGDSSGSSLAFTFTLSKASTSPVSLAYGTSDGSALAGYDYTAVSGQLTFAPGETSKTILVPILGDAQVEGNETMHLSISGVSGATALQSDATGTIFDDDSALPGVLVQISKGGHQAIWTDHDGDQVKLVSSKAILTQESFIFGADGDASHMTLQYLNIPTSAKGATSLVFSVKKSLSGDGLVDVGQISALGRDLSEVSIPGRLGSIQAGDTNLKTAGIHNLRVDSFGSAPAQGLGGSDVLESEVLGGVGNFFVKHDFTGAHLTVHGGSIQSLKIGGDLKGVAAGGETGISVEKSFVQLKVGGDISGADAAHPITIEAGRGALQALTAFGSIKVSGSVSHADFLAGENSSAAIHIGTVTVEGNWQASNFVVAASKGADGVFGTGDDAAYSDAISTIAKITVKGGISGTPSDVNALDHFGFVAGRIGAFQVGAQKLALSPKWIDAVEIGASSDVTVRELVGKPRQG